MIMAAHTVLANATKIEALELDKSEADMLAKSAVTVMDLYPAVSMSPKTMAWFGLASAMGVVYGPRLLVVRLQVAEARRARVAAGKTPEPFAFNMAAE